MMTYEMVMELLQTLGDDIMVSERDGDIIATVRDFEGCDDCGREYYRDYDEDAVDAIYDQLEEAALRVEGDFYRYFIFDGFEIVWGYESMDL